MPLETYGISIQDQLQHNIKELVAVGEQLLEYSNRINNFKAISSKLFQDEVENLLLKYPSKKRSDIENDLTQKLHVLAKKCDDVRRSQDSFDGVVKDHLLVENSENTLNPLHQWKFEFINVLILHERMDELLAIYQRLLIEYSDLKIKCRKAEKNA